jgi:hypothetical protein
MKFKFDFKNIAIIFIIAFVVNTIVVYFWDLFFHGQGTFNLGFSFTTALVLSVVLSFVSMKYGKEL